MDDHHVDEEILCLNTGSMDRKTLFIVSASTVIFSYLSYGFLLEVVFKNSSLHEYSIFLTMIQFLCYTVFSFIESLYEKKPTTFNYLRDRNLWAIGACTCGSLGFSNLALNYLNVPTQMVFKCCKPIPVMIAGKFISGSVYSTQKYLCTIAMIVGIIWFCLVDSTISPTFQYAGVCIIIVALMADAMLANLQEKYMRDFHCSCVTMVFRTFSIAFLILASFEALSGNLITNILALFSHPWIIIGMILYSLFGYCGILYVMCLIKNFGAYVNVMVTNFRKVASIIISFVIFQKPFSVQYIFAGGLIFASIIASSHKISTSDIKDSINHLKNLKISKKNQSAV